MYSNDRLSMLYTYAVHTEQEQLPLTEVVKNLLNYTHCNDVDSALLHYYQHDCIDMMFR